MAYALSRLHINGNQDTTHESTYKKEIVWGINDTKKLLEGIFYINFKVNQPT